MPDYTVDGLLVNAKLRAFLPDSNTGGTSLTDPDILVLANDELWGAMTPKIQKAVQEYFIQEFLFTLTPGLDVYDLPYRATGGALRDVYILTGPDPYTRQRLIRISPEQIQAGVTSGQQATSGGPTSFWVQANQILLYPHVQQAWTLVLSVFMRPNAMTPLDPMGGVSDPLAIPILSVNYGTGVVTVDGTVPATFDTTIKYDFIRAQPGFDTIGFDFPCSNISASDMTFGTALMSAIQPRLAVGDYVAVAQYAPVPQIPQTLHPLLSARVAMRIARAIGDKENAAVLAQDIADMEEPMYQMLVNRVEGKQDILTPNDLIGWTRPRFWTGPF